MLDSYKFLEEDRANRRENTIIKGTKITVEDIVKEFGLFDKKDSVEVSELDITKLISNHKYSDLKEEYVREALLYFENNKSEIRRRILFKQHLAKARHEIQQYIKSTIITEEDLKIVINARPY